MKIAAACLAVLFLGGCVALSSETAFDLDAEDKAPAGASYYLAKGLVELKLVVAPNNGQFTFTVGEPVFVPDEEHRYYMRYRAQPNAADDITITLNDDGRYLKSVHVTTTDKTGVILVNLAKAAGALGAYETSSTPAQKITLAKLIVDLANKKEADDALAAINSEAKRFIGIQYDFFCGVRLKAVNKLKARIKAIEADAKAESDAKIKAKLEAEKTKLETKLTGLTPAAVKTSCDAYRHHFKRKGRFVSLQTIRPRVAEFATPADCTVGICYRPKEPYLLTYNVGGTSDTKVVHLPNQAPLVAVDIRRAFLIAKIQKLEFDDYGFLKSIDIDKPSEALALAQLPLQLATAISEGLQLRIEYTNRKIEDAKKEAELIDAETQLRKDQQAYESEAIKDATKRGRIKRATSIVTPTEFKSGPGAVSQANANKTGTGPPKQDPVNGGKKKDDVCATYPFAQGCQ